ncbi:MAG TPA: cobalamin-dependent protein [Rhodoblastus sp.]|nr:cobalamin-dependent protein [Rhodoblastus sp.]
MIEETRASVILPRGTNQPIRVVVAKGGLDAHERGALTVTFGLRAAGFDVSYLGLRRTPVEVVEAALQNGADVIGISTLSGGHRSFVKKVLERLREAGASSLVVVGGLVPPEAHQELLDSGVARIFGQGALVSEIAEYLVEAVEKKRKESGCP